MNPPLKLDKDRIKEALTEDDIKLILHDLGSASPQGDRQGNLIFQTICHGGHKHKLYYYIESKVFHCFTDCSCNFDIFELVIKVKHQQGYIYTFPQAIQYVATLTGKVFTINPVFSQVNNQRIDDWDWINRHKKKTKISTELPTYNENVLDVFLPYPHQNWIEEGISYETQKKYEIGYYIREEKIVIPHRSISGKLIGIRGRATLQEDIDNGQKYMPLKVGDQLYNHPTMFNLYGIYQNQEAIKRLKKVAIFEGEKSVLKCEDYYHENNYSVASCSSTITNFHRDLLLSMGIEEVIICFDKFRRKKDDETNEKYEEALLDYQEKLVKLANKFTPYIKSYIIYDDFNVLDYKDSPVDKGKDILEQLMKNKYEIKTRGATV